MPDSFASAREKPKVWKFIQDAAGPMTAPNNRRRDWRVTADGETSIFVTYSKYYESSDCWWYGIDPKDLTEWMSYKQAFIVFVVDHEGETLVVPVQQPHSHIQKSTLALDKKSGHFKLHLVPSTGKYRFRELPGFELTGYYRNFSSLAGN
jgi:hypothetical protein